LSPASGLLALEHIAIQVEQLFDTASILASVSLSPRTFGTRQTWKQAGDYPIEPDLCSSTMQTFQLLEANASRPLPRVQCYFDDIFAFTYGDCNGEPLAITEFNATHECRKISKLHGLCYCVPAQYANEPWAEKFYLAHIFDHDWYGCPDGLVGARTSSLT
jgi:hypothetical protein